MWSLVLKTMQCVYEYKEPAKLNFSLTAPATTCAAMESIKTVVAQNYLVRCYFPQEDCWTLSCEDMNLTLSLLPCSQPPAVRVVYGDSVNQTFNSSDEVVIPGIIYDTYFDVTLNQICPSFIGLKVC